MAFNFIEEWHKLNGPGKIAVVGAIASIAALGIAAARSRAKGNQQIGIPTDNSQYGSFSTGGVPPGNNPVTNTPNTYKVLGTDTLANIAAKLGLDAAALWKLNPQIKNPNQIYAGQILRLNDSAAAQSAADSQSNDKYYTDVFGIGEQFVRFQHGDTLGSLAQKYGYGSDWRKLLALNPQLKDQYHVNEGYFIRVH